MKTRRTPPVFWLLLLPVFLTACSSGSENPVQVDEPSTAEEYLAQGWDHFEHGQYDEAGADFNAAIDLAADFGEAMAGLAWTRLVQADDFETFHLAGEDFQSAVNHGYTEAHVHAGWACALLGRGDDAPATADRAEAALDISSSFIFPHRLSFNAVDARLVWAMALAQQGQFAAALSQADLIRDSGISASAPATWVVAGETFASFPGAVLGHLHQLSNDYSG